MKRHVAVIGRRFGHVDWAHREQLSLFPQSGPCLPYVSRARMLEILAEHGGWARSVGACCQGGAMVAPLCNGCPDARPGAR